MDEIRNIAQTPHQSTHIERADENSAPRGSSHLREGCPKQIRMSVIIIEELRVENDTEHNASGSSERPKATDSRVAKEPHKTFPAPSCWGSSGRWCLRMPDRTQASHQSTHVERTHEDSLPSRVDPPEANRKVDFLQARRVQNQKNQENDSIEGVAV